MERVIEIGCMVSGLLGGICFGKHQLKHWEVINRKTAVILIAGDILTFGAGYWFMNLYGYHILKMIRYWILMYGLLLLALLDMEKKRIPNHALFIMTGVRTLLLAGECLFFPEMCYEIVISALVGLIGGGFLFLIAGIFIRNGIGMGDIKMIGVLGYYVGFQVLMSDLIITLTLTVFAGLIILITRKASAHTEIPFAPFVAVGTFVTILMGF